MIFSLGAVLINAGVFDVGIGPGVQVETIEPHALATDGELADVWPDRLVEFVTAHAKVGRSGARSQNARWARDARLGWQSGHPAVSCCFEHRHRCGRDVTSCCKWRRMASTCWGQAGRGRYKFERTGGGG